VLGRLFPLVGDQALRRRHADPGTGAAARFLFDLDYALLRTHGYDPPRLGFASALSMQFFVTASILQRSEFRLERKWL
jgi:hypothetical protein